MVGKDNDKKNSCCRKITSYVTVTINPTISNKMPTLLIECCNPGKEHVIITMIATVVLVVVVIVIAVNVVLSNN